MKSTNMEINDNISNLNRLHNFFTSKSGNKTFTKLANTYKIKDSIKIRDFSTYNNMLSKSSNIRQRGLAIQLTENGGKLPDGMEYLNSSHLCKAPSSKNSTLTYNKVYHTLTKLNSNFLITTDATKQSLFMSNQKEKIAKKMNIYVMSKTKNLQQHSFITPGTIFDSAKTNNSFIDHSQFLHKTNQITEIEELKIILGKEIYGKVDLNLNKYECHKQYTYTLGSRLKSQYNFYMFIEKSNNKKSIQITESFYVLYRKNYVNRNTTKNLQPYMDKMMCKRVILTGPKCNLFEKKMSNKSITNNSKLSDQEDIFINSNKSVRYNIKSQTLFALRRNNGPEIGELKMLFVKYITLYLNEYKFTTQSEEIEFIRDQFNMISDIKVLGDLGQILCIKEIEKQRPELKLCIATQDQIMAWRAVYVYKINTLFNSNGCFYPIMKESVLRNNSIQRRKGAITRGINENSAQKLLNNIKTYFRNKENIKLLTNNQKKHLYTMVKMIRNARPVKEVTGKRQRMQSN